MTDGAAWSDSFHGRHDPIRVDAVMPVQFRQRARLAEMLDPE